MRYFKRKLDDKNRLTIPAELRDELGGRVVITRGFGQYLHLYSAKVWDNQMDSALEGEWKSGPALPAILDQELADRADQLLEGMAETTLDSKQGRVTIEPDLLRYAGFDRNREISATKMPGGYWRLKTPQA